MKNKNRELLRDELNAALDYIVHLERGLGMHCVAITDKDQLDELIRAKSAIKEALKLEETL